MDLYNPERTPLFPITAIARPASGPWARLNGRPSRFHRRVIETNLLGQVRDPMSHAEPADEPDIPVCDVYPFVDTQRRDAADRVSSHP
jgi:hypothetical protein